MSSLVLSLQSFLNDTLFDSHHYLNFLPARRYASAGNSDRNVSVCLSRAGIVSKRRNLAA